MSDETPAVPETKTAHIQTSPEKLPDKLQQAVAPDGRTEINGEETSKALEEGRDTAPDDGHQKLNFDGLSDEALRDIAKEAGIRINKSWPRARIEQALRDAG